MPNWCSNKFIVKGDDSAIQRLIDYVKGIDPANNSALAIDFMKVIPQPKELNIESSSRTDYGTAVLEHREGHSDKLKKVLAYPWVQERNITDLNVLADHLVETDMANLEAGQQARDNIAKYGHKDWYSWRVDKWNTKWNATEQGEWKLGKGYATISFLTAWSPPIPVLEKLSLEFPELELKLSFTVEDEDHSELLAFRKGETFEEYETIN